MASKFILFVKDGEIRSHRLTKPQAPRRLHTSLSCARLAASFQQVEYCAFRYGGEWHIVSARGAAPQAAVKTFGSNRPAAEMWLLHQEAARATARV